MITDLIVALFVGILVVGGLYVPQLGDAVGRLLRGDGPREDAGDRAPKGPTR